MIFNSGSKTITTERLVLRLFQKSDAEDVARFCNNYNIYKNTLYIPYPYTKECAYTWMESHEANYDANKGYEFAITDKETSELYGAIALSSNKNFQNGELAYWIGEEHWGKGYATEASKAMLDFAFNIKGYHKVFARYFASNPASGKVMEKLGMEKEGVLKEHVKKEGQFEDLVYYGIISCNNN